MKKNLAQNSGAPRSQEDYITQVCEEIEGSVPKRLSKEFSRTENRILGALAQLDDFLMNPLLPGHSGTTPEPTRNTSHNNQGTNEDSSQNDPHPEVLRDTACNVHSTQQHRVTIVCEEIPLSEQRIPYKTLYTANSRIDCTAINRDTVKI